MAEKKESKWGQTYTLLAEPQVSEELTRLANPHSIGKTDVVSIQPCPTPTERSQDRFVVADWELSDGTWRFQACELLRCGPYSQLTRSGLDGHAGHNTVDHVAATLPGLVHDALVAGLAAGPLGAADVSSVLRKTIAEIDARIGEELLDLFHGGPEAIAALSDDEITSVINSAPNSAKVLRCMRGSTVLVALIGPNLDLWVASLGDCQAGT